MGKKCPLFYMDYLKAINEVPPEFPKCLGWECGRWDDVSSQCCDVENLRLLTAIGAVLGRLADSQTRARSTFRCHYCGLMVTTRPGLKWIQALRWTRAEQVDGRFVWSCEQCSEVKTPWES